MPSPPEAAFLEAILAESQDDSPRLIYADWLEEQGETDRAEFIRAQCALARAHQDHPLRPHWEERTKSLLNQNRVRWLGAFHNVCYLMEFRRGFVEEITLSGECFLSYQVRLFRAFPIAIVRLIKAAKVLEPLVACPNLGRVTALHLTDNKIGNTGVRLLAESPHLSRLTTLRLAGNELGDAGIQALAKSPFLGNLHTLHLGSNGISDTGARALARAETLTSLAHLELQNNLLTDIGAWALVESPNLARLQTLHLANIATRNLFIHTGGRGNRLSAATRQSLALRFGSRGTF